MRVRSLYIGECATFKWNTPPLLLKSCSNQAHGRRWRRVNRNAGGKGRGYLEDGKGGGRVGHSRSEPAGLDPGREWVRHRSPPRPNRRPRCQPRLAFAIPRHTRRVPLARPYPTLPTMLGGPPETCLASSRCPRAVSFGSWPVRIVIAPGLAVVSVAMRRECATVWQRRRVLASALPSGRASHSARNCFRERSTRSEPGAR